MTSDVSELTLSTEVITAPTAGTFRSSIERRFAHNVDDGDCSGVKHDFNAITERSPHTLLTVTTPGVNMNSTLSLSGVPHTLMTETTPDPLDDFSSRVRRSALRY